MKPCLSESQRLVIGRKPVEKYFLGSSRRPIVTKMEKKRFSYSYNLGLSSFAVFFVTSPHRPRVVDFLFSSL